MKIKAICFDIDGTLYPEYRLYARLFLPSLSHLRFLSAFSRVRHEIRELSRKREYHAEAPENLEDFRRFQASLVARKLSLSEEKASLMINQYIYSQSTDIFGSIRLFPHVRSSLESLKASGFALAAMSDFPVERKLELLRLSQFFDVAFSSEETGFLKPEREPFKVLAERLALAPAEILYVGNSVAYDILGAKAAGMRSALVSSWWRKHPEADYTFSDYRRLVAWIGAGATNR